MVDSAGGELTHAQTPIWIGQRLHPTSPLYNMVFAFVFPAELDVERFREAWQRVADASDALRTRIVESGTGGSRWRLAESAAPTGWFDLGARPDPEADFLRWCRRRSTYPVAFQKPVAGDDLEDSGPATALSASASLVDSVLVGLGSGRTGWYLNLHHLVADAWATQRLYRRVAEQYEALADPAGADASLPPLPPYYSTAYAVRERVARMREAERRRAQEHWQARGMSWPTQASESGAIGEDRSQGSNGGSSRAPRPVSRAPLYGRKPTGAGTRSIRSTLRLGQARSRALERLARQPGLQSLSDELSRFSLLAALLLVWMHRVTGERDLRFDAPVTGRPTPAAKQALGLFIEMFPFAATVEPGDTLRTLSARCLEEAKLFLAHALPGTSSPSGTAASHVVLNYFPAAFGPFAGLSPKVEWVHPGHGDSVHDLRLQVHDFAGSGDYVLHFDLKERVFPESLRRRAVEHFESILDRILDDPDQPIASLDLRTREEVEIVAGLDATTASSSGQRSPERSLERSVIEQFRDRVASEPDRVALRQGVRELTFGDLGERVGLLAAVLLKSGLQRGGRVAIVGKRSVELVIGILATLQARGAFVPVDSSVPPARWLHVLRDSGAGLVLTGGDSDIVREVTAARESGRLAVEVLSVADELSAAAKSGSRSAARTPDLEDLAYLIYTSGSTGEPKGVLVEHRGLSDYLDWAARHYVRGDRLTFPLFTSLAFDLTITSLFLPLVTGGTLEIYPEPDGPLDTALMDVVDSNSVDFIKLTPSHLGLMERLQLAQSRIRRVVVGGENFPLRLAASIHNQLNGGAGDGIETSSGAAVRAERSSGGAIEIYNEYGPTEAVVGCVVHRYDPAVDLGTNVPIGTPADHVRVEILNEALSPVPVGVPGELWISRTGLALGYHRRPSLTAERFRPLALPRTQNEISGERWYRTGDRVRVGESGELEFLGRLDRQLKLSGFRVEPAEVESALLSLPGIDGCAVVARTQAAAGPTAELHRCTRCGLSSNYPKTTFDEAGVCNTCQAYDAVKEHAQAYFKTMDDLRDLFEAAESARSGQPTQAARSSSYDCMMLLSGGKDSTYALCRLVDMGLSVYAFTLDNGFIAEGAKQNIRRVADQLGVPVEFATTPAMNAIFRDSLMRFSNVCNGCFKTIYTLSMKRARELEIPVIVTGLSRGQMFETRLTEEVFRDGRRSPDDIDAAVLSARKAYHRADDVVARSLSVGIFEDDRIFDQVRFVDFYRYCDVSLDEVYAYLKREIPWVRPEDTGRSTNCLINDAGIYVHKQERGFHNYALPYSWDVRLGHKSRDEALAELDDEIDVPGVRKILDDVGYVPRTERSGQLETTTLAAFYVASEDLSEVEIRRELAQRLPPHLVPSHFQRIESIPLTRNGKVDEEALAEKTLGRPERRPYRQPDGPVEEFLAEVWQEELGLGRVGADDHFFELGGTSLSAIQVMLRLCQEFDLDLSLDGIFTYQTLTALARMAEDRLLADAEEILQSDGENG